jgi:hypothetical protein
MNERRSVARHKSFLQGRIFFNNRRTSLDCLIRDISEHGARLKFSGMVSTPDLIELHIPSKEESYRAKVQWRNGDEIGVCFGAEESTPTLAPGMPQQDLSVRVHKLEHELAVLQRRFSELLATVRHLQGAD